MFWKKNDLGKYEINGKDEVYKNRSVSMRIKTWGNWDNIGWNNYFVKQFISAYKENVKNKQQKSVNISGKCYFLFCEKKFILQFLLQIILFFLNSHKEQK